MMFQKRSHLMSASALAGVLAIHEEEEASKLGGSLNNANSNGSSSNGILRMPTSSSLISRNSSSRGPSIEGGRSAPHQAVQYHSTNTHPPAPSRSPSLAASQIAATLAAGSASGKDKRPKSPARSPSPPISR